MQAGVREVPEKGHKLRYGMFMSCLLLALAGYL